jgi:hypothetical protein
MRTSVLIASICLSVAGCSSENRIEPIYVAPRQFQSLSCEEIAGEAQRVARSAAMLAGAPAARAPSSDRVIVWPALATAKPDQSTRLALGRLKGEFDALVLAGTQKSCGLTFQQDST